MFFLGAGAAAFMALTPKILGSRFPRNRLATVTAIAASAVTVFTAGAMATSGSLLSPALHGWRNIMLVTGAACVAIGLVWLLVYRDIPLQTGTNVAARNMREGFGKVMKIREVWLFGILHGPSNSNDHFHPLPSSRQFP